MKLHRYLSSSGRDVVKDYIDSLTKEERVDGYSVLECMEKGEFDKIKCKLWAKRVYEVYFFKHNRIFYIIADGENIFLLHACRKQKNKTEKKDKRIVVERAKEVGKLLGKKFV